MKLKLIISLLFLTTKVSLAQVDTVKVYDCTSSKSSENGLVTYKIDDNIVSKEVYEKYTLNEINPPRLIYRKGYDITENLMFEGLSYHYCWVGTYKEYYTNGNIAVDGNHSRISSVKGDLTKINEFKDCAERHGEWKFYLENGELFSTEYWDMGKFIRQEPIQDTASIWKVGIKINGDIYSNKDAINIDDLKKMEPLIYYKNKSRICRDFSFIINMKRGTKEIDTKKLKNEKAFGEFDIKKWLKNNKAKLGDRLEICFIQSCYMEYRYWEPVIILPLN